MAGHNWSFWTNYLVGHDYGKFVDVTKYVNNFSWTDDKDTTSVSFTFDSILDFAEYASHVVLKKDSKTVFSGRVTQKAQNKASGNYTCLDYADLLNIDQLKSYQFNDQDAKSCIYRLVWDVGLKGACIAIPTKIKQFYWGKTYIDIIKDILSKASLDLGDDIVFEMQDTTAIIQKTANLKLSCKYVIGDDYSTTRNGDNMVNYVIVSNTADSEDTATGKATILATQKDDSRIKIYGIKSKIISSESVKTSAQARNLAKNYLKNFNATNKELTVTLLDVEGCEDIKANRKINIPLNKYGVNGYYKVKSANHTLNNGAHKVAVTIDFSGVNFVDITSTT